MQDPKDVSYSTYAQATNQLPKSGYGFMSAVIGSVRKYSADLVREIESYREHGGNPGHPVAPLLCAVVLQYLTNTRYANRFLSELDANEGLLAICGLKRAPTESTYCRFRKKLVSLESHIDRLTANILADINVEIEVLRGSKRLGEDAPKFGEYLAIDSTDIEAYGNPNRTIPRDPHAKWGHRTKKSKSAGKKQDELFYGYKNHEIGDGYYGLPIGGITLPANAGDGPQLPVVVEKIRQDNVWLEPKYLLADKAYAGLERFEFVVQQGMTPIISVPRPVQNAEGRRLFDGLYDLDGRPVCLGGESMQYVKSDPLKGHLFKCPNQGCHLKDVVQWTTHCDTELWEKPEGKLLRILGILPRFTALWKKIYKMRTSIERYFGSAKHSRLLNQHQFLKFGKIRIHVAMSRLSYLATSLAHLEAGQYALMRCMRIELANKDEQGSLIFTQGMSHRNELLHGGKVIKKKLEFSHRKAQLLKLV